MGPALCFMFSNSPNPHSPVVGEPVERGQPRRVSTLAQVTELGAQGSELEFTLGLAPQPRH